MKGMAASILVLTASAFLVLTRLASPALAAEPVAGLTSDLPSEPSLSFDPAVESVTATSHPFRWYTDGLYPGEYRVDSWGDSAIVIAQPGALHRGGMSRVSAPGGYLGKRVRLSARLKSQEVGQLQMWLRIQGPDLAQQRFYNMADQPITGTTDWRPYEIVMEVPQDATGFAYGFFINDGKGKAWGEAFKLEIVGPEVALTPLTGIAANGWQRRDLAALRLRSEQLRAARAAYQPLPPPATYLQIPAPRPAMGYDLRPDPINSPLDLDSNSHVPPASRQKPPHSPYTPGN